MTRGLLAFVIFAGSLALWTAIPIAWLYLTSALSPGPRFVLVIFGLPLTMALTFMLLSLADAYRRRLRPAGKAGSNQTAIDGSPEEDGRSLLEVMLVVSAIIALVGLVVWWFFIANAADPSGPLQPV